MKITSNNPKMFIGDRQVEDITSFSFNTGNTSKYETIMFKGVYNPNCTNDESLEIILAILKNEFIGTITLPNGEKRDALLQANYQDGIITLIPIDENIQEWCKKGLL